jgi:hypothetical protein
MCLCAATGSEARRPRQCDVTISRMMGMQTSCIWRCFVAMPAIFASAIVLRPVCRP